MSTEQQEYMDSKQLATWLGVSASTVVNMRRRRQIPYIQMGHVIRFNRTAVEAVLKKSFTIEEIASRSRNHQ
jgi:excisionase family DNA binding protein